jgi:hypothetical protein
LQRLFQVAHALALAVGVCRGQAGRHRLDRLALAIQQQPAQVGLSWGALVGARHRGEHLFGEGDQPPAHPAQARWGELGCCALTLERLHRAAIGARAAPSRNT